MKAPAMFVLAFDLITADVLCYCFSGENKTRVKH